MVCVHRGGDIMYTRTGDYFGKTKFYNDGAHQSCDFNDCDAVND